MWRLPKRWCYVAACVLLPMMIVSFVCVQERTQNTQQQSFLDMYVEKYGNYRILEESLCLMDGSCVNIVDRVENGNEKKSIFREMVLENFRISRMRLKLPNELNDNNLDSSRWMLDKGAADSALDMIIMIEEMFATGAVEIRRDADAKVLSLGLGAGYINSYLHYNFPNMDITTVELDPAMLRIAKKWYALDEDYRHRVIIDDGLNYVKCAAESGIQYEVVHLDICTTDPDAKSLCPIDIFFTEEPVRVLSKLISERGVVIVNVVSARYDSNVIANELKSHFEEFFHQCVLRVLPNSWNVIMSCTNVTRPDRLDAAYRKFAGYSIAD